MFLKLKNYLKILKLDLKKKKLKIETIYLNILAIKSYFMFKKVYTINHGKKYKILYHISLGYNKKNTILLFCILTNIIYQNI